MLRKSFLSLLVLTFLFQIKSFAQHQLIKDFDGGALSSFNSDYTGVLYSIGSKVIVQYDSIYAGQYQGYSCLASVDNAGNSEQFVGIYTTNEQSVFYDFKTLPNGKIAFVATDSDGASSVIVSDGTISGTTFVYTSAQSIPGLELIDNGLYFTYYGDPEHFLMKIDLTTLTVSEVLEFGDFRMISDISKVSNTSLIFMAPDAADSDILKLYVSDGTAGGTTELAVINSGSEFSQNTVMTQVGDKVYFFYKKPGVDCCNDLWVTDGTVAGTVKLKEFNIVYFTDFVREGKAIAWEDKFYFAAVPTGGNTNNDESLWVSDGTVSGTVRLNDPEDYESPKNFTVFKDELYFIAYSNLSYKNKLYKTDGTEAGTESVDLVGYLAQLSPYAIAADATYLYLAANFLSGSTIYRFDGTYPNCDYILGSPHPTQHDMLYVNETDLYFTAGETATGVELFTVGNFRQALDMATSSSADYASVVYPNPATSQVTVTSLQQIVSLKLIGQLGSVLYETTESTISMDSYAEGVYFIKIEFESGQSSFEKIILVK